MLSHLIRLTTSGEIKSDFSIHLGRIHSGSIFRPTPLRQHEPVHHTPASRDLLAPNFSTPSSTTHRCDSRRNPVPISSSMPRSPPASSSSRFRKPFNSVRCFFSSSALDGGKYVRMHRISPDFLKRDQLLTNCFLNRQGFDGDLLESSTTTSEHDGTTRTGIHAMNDTTPVLCVKLTHHVHKAQSFKDSPQTSIQFCLTRTQKKCAVVPDSTQR